MYDTLITGANIVAGTGSAPFTGDVAIKDGQIAAVSGRDSTQGSIAAEAKEVIDAKGALLTPGWVDVHTHYDGQVTWDDEIDPSFSHGVTTVVMGNCGVGFAPVPPGGEKELIELMEGVEDIPGTALYEGMPWGSWTSFPEYLDYLATREYSLDISAQIAHGALRYFVMGERGLAHEPATAEDMAKMAQLTEEAVAAGAVGFSTSRTIGHRSVTGNEVPGTFAEEEELLAIADGMKRTGKGVFELIPAAAAGDMPQLGGEKQTTLEEFEMIKRIAKASGRPMTFTQIQVPDHPDVWREVLDRSAAANAEGLNVRPQIASRPIGLVTSIATYHMFQQRPTYLKLAHLPLAERVAELQKPEIKAAILSEEDAPVTSTNPMAGLHKIFAEVAGVLHPLEDPVDYEPDPATAFASRAQAKGQDIHDYMYDFLLEKDGNSFAILLGGSYVEGNHNAIAEMLAHPSTITGLSDAGAHVNLIFDGVAPTYQLIHWARDRSRGDKLPLELIVHKQTLNNAELYGFTDRGQIAVGKRADLNLIDHNNLQLGSMKVLSDLPAGGNRILQEASGYIGTWVNGVRTRKNDTDTGARPGRLLRSS